MRATFEKGVKLSSFGGASPEVLRSYVNSARVVRRCADSRAPVTLRIAVADRSSTPPDADSLRIQIADPEYVVR